MKKKFSRKLSNRPKPRFFNENKEETTFDEKIKKLKLKIKDIDKLSTKITKSDLYNIVHWYIIYPTWYGISIAADIKKLGHLGKYVEILGHLLLIKEIYNLFKDYYRLNKFNIHVGKYVNYMGPKIISRTEKTNLEYSTDIWLNFDEFNECKYNLKYMYKKYGNSLRIYRFEIIKRVQSVLKFNYKYTPKDFSNLLKSLLDVDVTFEKGFTENGKLLGYHSCLKEGYEHKGIYVERNSEYFYLSNLFICSSSHFVMNKEIYSIKKFLKHHSKSIQSELKLNKYQYEEIKNGNPNKETIEFIINSI
jgi:hypothetical protein